MNATSCAFTPRNAFQLDGTDTEQFSNFVRQIQDATAMISKSKSPGES